MSDLDQTRNPEERIQQALAKGPDIDAPGRYGMVTRLVRRFVGRAVKYERDYGLQIDVALLERLHEMEASFTEQLDEVSTRLRRELGDDDRRLRESTEQLLDNDHRAQRDLWGVISRVEALEGVLIDVRSYLQDVDSRAAVAHAIGSGAADGIDSIMLATSQVQAELARVRDHVVQLSEAAVRLRTDADKAVFVYDELTSRPYTDENHPLVTNDARGRACLGYRGVSGPSPLYLGFEDIFRGSEALIRDRQRVYLDVVGRSGAGRRSRVRAGRDARAPRPSRHRVPRGRSRRGDGRPRPRQRRNVDHGDALEFLVKQEDASLGAIFSAQFIEHLPAGLLPELLELARTKLLPDGVFIAETVNPHSPRALKAFWIDPTHQHPLVPRDDARTVPAHGFRRGPRSCSRSAAAISRPTSAPAASTQWSRALAT